MFRLRNWFEQIVRLFDYSKTEKMGLINLSVIRKSDERINFFVHLLESFRNGTDLFINSLKNF